MDRVTNFLKGICIEYRAKSPQSKITTPPKRRKPTLVALVYLPHTTLIGLKNVFTGRGPYGVTTVLHMGHADLGLSSLTPTAVFTLPSSSVCLSKPRLFTHYVTSPPLR